MSNHLKSAGKLLKESSNDLRTLFFLPIIIGVIITLIFLRFLYLHPNFDTNSGSFPTDLKVTLTFISMFSIGGFIFNIITYFSLTSNINKSGDFLILFSETIEIKSSEETNDNTNVLKLQNLKGEIQKVTTYGKWFLVVENREYYYDSGTTADNSMEHYKQTGNLLEEGLLKP